MKKYFSWILIGIIIILTSVFYYLFQTNRIILQYDTSYLSTKTPPIILFPEKSTEIHGIYYTTLGELKKIPLQLSYEEYKNFDDQEKILSAYLHQYFYYLNLEKNSALNYFFYHLVVEEDSVILNLHLEKKRKLSLEEEYHLLKGLFLTIQNIVKKTTVVYFFDGEKPLPLTYLIPFFSLNFLEKYSEKKQEQMNHKEFQTLYIIPLLIDNGNICEDTYEKNIFQSFQNQEYIFTPKQKYPFFFEEINQHSLDIVNKVILYTNISIRENKKIKAYYYPVHSRTKIKNRASRWILPEEESDSSYLSNLSLMKDLELSLAPIIPLINTIYPSLYITIEAPSIKDAQETLSEITFVLLNKPRTNEVSKTHDL